MKGVTPAAISKYSTPLNGVLRTRCTICYILVAHVNPQMLESLFDFVVLGHGWLSLATRSGLVLGPVIAFLVVVRV
jgi:hypothetical protein